MQLFSRDLMRTFHSFALFCYWNWNHPSHFLVHLLLQCDHLKRHKTKCHRHSQTKSFTVRQLHCNNEISGAIHWLSQLAVNQIWRQAAMHFLIRDASMFAFSLSGYNFRILILFEMEQMSILWYPLQVESSSKKRPIWSLMNFKVDFQCKIA